MNFKYLMLLSTSLVIILQSGCKLLDYNNDHVLIDISYNIMPNVINSDINKIGNILNNKGYNVYVKKNAISYTSVKYKEISLDTKLVPFSTHKWNHMISTQSPAAGSVLRHGDTIILTAGIHHGAGPMMPWIETHGVIAKFKDSSRCFVCHDNSCLGCHVLK